MRKTDIILAGVGGQGILTIAAIIAKSALEAGMHIKQAEVHGMSQRGGAVQSNLRISDKPVASDLIPQGKADLILAVEPMEALRYLPYLSKNGWIVSNAAHFINIPNYPEPEAIEAELKKINNLVLIDADRIAADLGTSRASNIVMLGAASPFIDVDNTLILQSISDYFKNKGEKIVNLNLDAFALGRQKTNEVYVQ